jgi:hypothetical protein
MVMISISRWIINKSSKNKFGLERKIPESIAREVRQRCGFGCVICGLSLYDYEHFDPDFKEATAHNTSGITLLCMQCNQKRNRKVLSVETVKCANENPKSLQQGFSNEAFDFGSNPIEIVFAGVTFINCDHWIRIDGTPILSIKNPEQNHAPYRLSGLFCNDVGEETLEITDNKWSVSTDNWDVECKGAKITIRKGSRDIVLVLKSDPPRKLIIERLNMYFKGIFLRGDQDVLRISDDGITWIEFQDIVTENFPVGIDLPSPIFEEVISQPIKIEGLRVVYQNNVDLL